MIPGSRALNGGMALNRWVTPVAPSATACLTTSAGASLCPIEIRTPAEANFRTKLAETHSGASDAGEFAQLLQVARTRLRDPIGPVDTRTSRTDERAFEVQAEDSIMAGDRASRRDCGSHSCGCIGNEGWQAAGRAKATVRPGYGAHAVGGRLIVQEDAATPVDLQIDEAGSQERARRKTCLRPIGRNVAPPCQPNNAPLPDEHRGFGMPVVTVKNPIRHDGMPLGD